MKPCHECRKELAPQDIWPLTIKGWRRELCLKCWRNHWKQAELPI